MSTTIPYASHLYSTNYKFVVGQEPLKELKSATFRTHTSIHAERLHRVSEAIFLPARLNLQLFARIIEPLPGANKDHPLWGVAIRIACFVFALLLLPISAISSLIAFPLRCLEHRYRPAMSYLEHPSVATAKAPETLHLTQENPLHVRTHNLGFVLSSMSIVGDLRPPVERAKEVVKSILGDPCKPDIIFFNEAFHEDATRVLCEGIAEEYPHIVHSVAPQVSGFSAGSLIASKYPLEEIEFHRFGHISAPENMAPRGMIRARLKSPKGPILLYSVHTEALIGEKRAQARFDQLDEIKNFMRADLEKYRNAEQIIVGDFNTSRVTAWGEDNLTPKGQAEAKVLERLNADFDDLFLRDHDPLTGVRTSGAPKFLKKDNRLLGENLPEPSGSWYHGPFAHPGFILPLKMRFDRWKNNRPAPQKVNQIPLAPSTWGTPKWRALQPANTARFDYILLPNNHQMDGRVEIRRNIVPKGAQSAPTDHLPVDGLIWRRPKIVSIC